MKGSNANSVRAQEDISQFGEAARHPVCQAWLSVRRTNAVLLKLGKEAKTLLETLNDAQDSKKTAQWLVDRFCEERKEKEAIEALAVVQRASEYLLKLQTVYESTANLFENWLEELLPVVEARFERECDALALGPEAKCKQAIRALRTVKERWENKKPLADTKRRELEVIKILRHKAAKGAQAKGGVMEGYAEIVFGNNRLLADEHWAGRVTAQELRSCLIAIGGPRLAGDNEAKQIRLVAKKLGIRLAEDQRGRKEKPPQLRTRKPGKPVGRPSTRVYTRENVANLEATSDARSAQKESTGGGLDNLKASVARIKYTLKKARADWASVRCEINRLVLKRGGRREELVIDKGGIPRG